MREQHGTIILRSGKWHVSYWQKQNINGKVERKRATEYLGKKARGKDPSLDIEEACKRFMATLNANSQTVKPEQVLTITSFVDSVYMPWVRANKRAATINGYEKLWKKHLKGHFGNMLLRDYQPRHATALLSKLAEKQLGLNAS
jgi:integrase-like protein